MYIKGYLQPTPGKTICKPS